MSEWIKGSDRLPTEADANDLDCVLVSESGGMLLQLWSRVSESAHWTQLPRTPGIEPEPDTSLANDIRWMEQRIDNLTLLTETKESYQRIIAAAKEVETIRGSLAMVWNANEIFRTERDEARKEVERLEGLVKDQKAAIEYYDEEAQKYRGQAEMWSCRADREESHRMDVERKLDEVIKERDELETQLGDLEVSLESCQLVRSRIVKERDELREKAALYEDLRKLIDGGSESMTHEDARNEIMELQEPDKAKREDLWVSPQGIRYRTPIEFAKHYREVLEGDPCPDAVRELVEAAAAYCNSGGVADRGDYERLKFAIGKVKQSIEAE